MYIVTLYMTFAMLTLGLASAEIAMAYTHGVAQKIAGTYAQRGLSTAESAYIGTLATNIQDDLENGIVFDSSRISIANVNVPACGDTSPCAYYLAYAVVPDGSTAAGGSGETSQNVNLDVEQRVSVTVTVYIRNVSGTTLAARTRTITLRTYPMAPYASVINTGETQEPFVGGGGGVGTVGGTATNGVAEGDAAGCDGASATTTPSCGSNTTIARYSGCYQQPGSNSTVGSIQKQWCAEQSVSTIGNGYFQPTASPDPASTDLQNVNTTRLGNETWNPNTSTVNAGN